MRTHSNKMQKGFTLLELLITVAIIAILSVILIIVLNPAETLKKSRDTQRISDLSTVKTAIGLYLTSIATPYLGGATSNTACKSGSAGGGSGTYGAGDMIWYSYPSDAPGGPITDATFDGGLASVPDSAQVTNSNLSATDGTGWLPVNLASISGGSPISNMPVDPVNTIGTLTAVTSSDLVYRYACNESRLTFEIDAQLESDAFTIDDDKRKTDGGNNSSMFEVGTGLKILGTGSDF